MSVASAGQGHTGKVRFGVFEFDPQARELTKHGTPLKVQEQPLQILAALLEHAGQIVSREDLQRRLWPEGTFVDYEQSLNKAVNKLREALGDSADKPVYIETIPRRGYRFLAPVEREVETATPSAPARKRRVWLWLVAGAAVLGVIFVTGLWPIQVPQVVRVVRLTSDNSEKLLPLVADGSKVLYSDYARFWAVPSEGGLPQRIPLPFLPATAFEVYLYFSGRSSQTILLSSWPGEKGTAELWLMRPDGDSPRKIGEVGESFGSALSPDGQRLAITLPDGLYIQSIATGERKRILPAKWQGRSTVWWHPSGRIIGFLGGSSPADRRTWQVNDDGGRSHRIVPEREQGQGSGAWSPDGNRFYFFSLENDGEIWVRTQAKLLGWLRKPAVTRLTASGQIQAMPTVDPIDPKRLYVTGAMPRGDTVRYDRAARKWVPFLAGISAEWVEWSPDGQSMVYLKYPGYELHQCRLDGTGDVLLAPGVWAYHFTWSPDGKRIAFPGRRAGSVEPWKLWLVSAGGGDAAPYKPEIESGSDTIWSRDGKRILIGQAGGRKMAPGESRVKILTLETGQIEQVPGGERIFSPRWSPDGYRICGLDLDRGNLVVYEPSKRQWRDLTNHVVWSPTWSSDGKYIYGGWGPVAAPRSGRIEVVTGRLEEIARPDFKLAGNLGPWWVGWTKDWDPLVLRDAGSNQIFRIDLDR